MAKQIGFKKPAPDAPKPKLGVQKGGKPATKTCPDCGQQFTGKSCPGCAEGS